MVGNCNPLSLSQNNHVDILYIYMTNMPNIFTQSVIKAKNQNQTKTVNHLVPDSEEPTIQPLPSVSACKNHLVIVWTIQLSRKRIRDAALYTFVYHYTFAAKSKSLII